MLQQTINDETLIPWRIVRFALQDILCMFFVMFLTRFILQCVFSQVIIESLKSAAHHHLRLFIKITYNKDYTDLFYIKN